ncbi:bifunctional methylenetetrahydrofolate dehydrogenase/methenyltetrahydrofolate cyclohydrolase FolD [Terrarubrum flagellatum]|uniref:bifunctional methylenetetrahydrofolate dehydrogenase/methenyltetrahydrofolate cyclohydrolase FolD n=1 Tax=Terrirubrum flagellatum TaxID=2895980 RepID=UPI0031453EAA
MSARIIDGVAHAEALRARVRETVARLNVSPGLAVVLVGDDPASQVYVRTKSRQAQAVGIAAMDHRLPATTTEVELLAVIARLNVDPAVHGILVQLPLPAHIVTANVLRAIDPAKDVDGFHPVNVGLLATGRSEDGFTPCTPLGCLLLLKETLGDLAGRDAIVLGRSMIVGKPMAQLLLNENCTVTVAHSRTRDLADRCRSADIVIAAVGRPGMVRGDWIRPGATVIDVGINRLVSADGKSSLVGDVAFEEVFAVAGALTPVPGGVGPMTIACLLANTATAAFRSAGVDSPDWSLAA